MIATIKLRRPWDVKANQEAGVQVQAGLWSHEATVDPLVRHQEQ